MLLFIHLSELLTPQTRFAGIFSCRHPQCAACDATYRAVLTQSVRENLQPLNPLVFVKLQAVNAVETVVLDQIQRRVHGHLAQTQQSLG